MAEYVTVYSPDGEELRVTAKAARVIYEPAGFTTTRAPEPSLTPPPKNGAGSGRDAWAAFASANGVEVDDDVSRDDIISTLTERGVISE